MSRAWWSVALLIALTVTACGPGPTPEPSPPPPTVTPAVATATPPPPTATPSPSPTAAPTATATATPRPTATVTATAMATPTVTPTVNPATASPLTGRSLAAAERRTWAPLAVQIDNDPQARPQAGLAAASVVVETPTEAGLTRFTALYLDQEAPLVGPLRSARLVNLELTPEYQAVLVSVGGSDGVLDQIRAARLPYLNLIGSIGATASWRVAEREAPFNLYSGTGPLRQAARDLGLERPTNLAPGAHGPLAALPGGAAAPPSTSVSIAYRLGAVRFDYDAATGRYQRLVDGQPQHDAGSGEPIAPHTVVIQRATFTVTDIIEDSLGSHSLAVRLRGQGELLLLREGRLFRGTWQRAELGQRTIYRDEAGRPLTLAPGQTWIALVPAELAVTTTP